MVTESERFFKTNNRCLIFLSFLLLGTVMVFRAYGVLCGVFLVLFVAVNFAALNEGESDKEMAEEAVSVVRRTLMDFNA